MMCTASAATSAGVTTRRMGSVARSSFRRLSSSSPRSDADNGVSTKPAAMRLTRMGASSSARLAVRAGSATVTVHAAHKHQAASRFYFVASGPCCNYFSHICCQPSVNLATNSNSLILLTVGR